MIRLAFLLFCIRLFSAGNPNPTNAHLKKEKFSDGPHKFYHFNGKPSEEFTIKDGNLHGTRRVWFANGQLADIKNFDNGAYIDTCRQYFENGNIKTEDAWDHDTLLYYCEYEYYKDGKKKAKRYLEFDRDSLVICPFLKAKTNMPSIDFDVNLTIKDMKNHGRYIEYFRSGNIWMEIEMVNHKYEGKFNQYNEEKKLIYTGTYHNDVMDGVFTYYNADGTATIEN
jgi:antitoxin component YwqK of YwqJK toxin-antitoxin module